MPSLPGQQSLTRCSNHGRAHLEGVGVGHGHHVGDEVLAGGEAGAGGGVQGALRRDGQHGHRRGLGETHAKRVAAAGIPA